MNLDVGGQSPKSKDICFSYSLGAQDACEDCQKKLQFWGRITHVGHNTRVASSDSDKNWRTMCHSVTKEIIKGQNKKGFPFFDAVVMFCWLWNQLVGM